MRLALVFVLFFTGCTGKEITVSREELKDIKVVDVMDEQARCMGVCSISGLFKKSEIPSYPTNMTNDSYQAYWKGLALFNCYECQFGGLLNAKIIDGKLITERKGAIPVSISCNKSSGLTDNKKQLYDTYGKNDDEEVHLIARVDIGIPSHDIGCVGNWQNDKDLQYSGHLKLLSDAKRHLERVNKAKQIAYSKKLKEEKIIKNQQTLKIEKEKFMIELESRCKSFGYKKGSEKFADCMRELYVLEAKTNAEAKLSAETQASINRENQATIDAARRELEAVRAEQEAQRRANERQQGWDMFQKGIEMMNPSSPSTNRTYNCSVSDAYGNVQCR